MPRIAATLASGLPCWLCFIARFACVSGPDGLLPMFEQPCGRNVRLGRMLLAGVTHPIMTMRRAKRSASGRNPRQTDGVSAVALSALRSG